LRYRTSGRADVRSYGFVWIVGFQPQQLGNDRGRGAFIYLAIQTNDTLLETIRICAVTCENAVILGGALRICPLVRLVS
jgi:hypothetical protein